jgi:predicted helicase
MSIHAINQYQSEVEKIIHFGGTKKETAIRNAFYNLLNEYAKQKGLMMVPELTIRTVKRKNVTPDGTLKDSLRQDWGYWESKDESDNIDDEIKKKFAKDYPSDNILFEDSQTAILIQSGIETMRISMKDADALDRIIHSFINFERPEVQNFRRAIELFKQDIPKVTDTIRGIIIAQEKTNNEYKKTVEQFLKLCHDSINPNISMDDVREMVIQHILTEDIFNTIFDETQFHRENNIARELEKVIHTFFSGNTKRIALSTIQHYYQAINAAAAGIADHHEKQKFLKVIYETFYKSYNPKAADRLGVVYTPNEIVKFMIESTDYLLHKHFNRFLEDPGVEILDPATGTGTFICDIIDHIKKDKLEHKFKNEIHANEVAILPYYISNLNIEFTYAQKMGKYSEFENLCFVDTLDNMGFAYRGKQIDMFSPFTEENTKRIRKQNTKRIAVVIGNPPYNANQLNENDNNKNREYKEIDKRIKDTFIFHSTAQKTKVYDMYARFYRWAFDRLDDNGIVAFITNRSFIESRTFDGFRKVVANEFNHIHIIDLGGDVRINPKLSGTKHNVFGIQTGVAICFLVKKSDVVNKKGKKVYVKQNGCKIYYSRRPEFETATEKLHFISTAKIENIEYEHIIPDKANNWINLTSNDFDSLIPLVSKIKNSKTLFSEYTIGSNTARDEWTYDFDSKILADKINYLIDTYNTKLSKGLTYENDKSIKWTRGLKQKFDKKTKLAFNMKNITTAYYRPFVKQFLYHSSDLVEMPSSLPKLTINKNFFIVFSGSSHSKPFQAYSTDSVFSFDFLEKTTGVPLFTFDKSGNPIENITDWGLTQFVKRYKTKKISKEDIFYYVYAVLHNPDYREKYELNLKREFPRIPFYSDFNKWCDFGKALFDLHINYEEAEPFKLKETTNNDIAAPKAKLKADKERGTIILDEATFLSGIPKEAWEYKLGNRSALEWILDQFKESKSKDETIAERFDTYRFADYKIIVIDLIMRVCTVSVRTIEIINEMKM